ncbi:hypothetical protein FZEAL_942 [Fusarium zealandicum]|uniref:DUF6606 domain-containing protein n=1 Tax=Fusarium zealandicum TaxID=1053134 RepID=A0A8H4UU74_9HYPO|nr:hypothetical protein FZEAL_942 [Fusarium zealandicum]
MAHVPDITATTTKERLNYLFHHLFLPAKLPGEDDSSSTNEAFLVDFVLHCLKRFLVEVESENERSITTCISMMETLRNSTDTYGYLREDGVGEVLRQLSPEGCVALHIAAQNAAVLIRKVDASVYFETFELSPTNASVFARGRLVRQFPDAATAILFKDFEDEAFQSVLARTVAKMSHQTVQEMKKKVKKAKQQHDEDRDTVEPRIVTELLTSILRGMGKSIDVSGICKNTREEVMWNNSKLPWRRSPVWLLVRVSLQLTMSRPTSTPESLYKPFMVFMFAQALGIANQQPTPSDVLHTMVTKVSGRLCKLESSPDGKWLEFIRQTVSGTSDILAKRWHRICERSEQPLDLDALSSFEMKDSVYFSLPKTGEFLSSIPLRKIESRSSTFSPASYPSPLGADRLPLMRSNGSADYLPFHVAMVES